MHLFRLVATASRVKIPMRESVGLDGSTSVAPFCLDLLCAATTRVVVLVNF
jgi:hypothetical protein